ncbi:052a4909-88fc-47e8-85c6-81385c0f7e6b-CDS [Sclerotinia trifoliorum]|uniref:052a4909-88fc-47e8-85c6-81385c0f7e6b-CDS n=1 Tax=Sclerotinia trifoliorum TaxID=28548 RepID=A0A8H2VZI2_9HELO|nr:052a4909-88fc-47e8-85c6-81385c0f7e6b-CDS [Sclerotinia trifoliorum]
MAGETAFPRGRTASMSSQKSASPVNRTFLKSSLKKPSDPSVKDSSSNPPTPQSSQHESFSQKIRPKSFPLSNIKAPVWLSNFRASKTGAYALQFLDISRRWFLRHVFKFFLAALVYTGLIFLIAKDNAITSRNNLTYISDLLKVAGGFPETLDEGYLVDNIPPAFQKAGTVLRDFYNERIENDDPFAWPVHALLAEVEAIDFGWESFRESRDEAVTSIKEQVKSSRLVFQDELKRLRGVGAKNRNRTSWKRLGKKLLLDDPYESRAHFDAKNFANITGSIQNYISTWRATSIPQLSYRLTSTKRGPTGGLPGKMNEVRKKWPKIDWRNWKFFRPPVDKLEEVREEAISILKRVDGMYGGFLSVIHLLDLAADKEKRRGFGEEHLEELLGVFDETFRRLQQAEWDNFERSIARTYPL